MLHAYAVKFNVTRNLKKFTFWINILGKLPFTWSSCAYMQTGGALDKRDRHESGATLLHKNFAASQIESTIW
jgi:hypothetical protein